MAGKRERLCVGIIGAPRGVRGEVRIKSFTANPLDIAAYGPVETEDGRKLTITAVQPVKGMVAARFKGIANRDQAEALKNVRLYIDRALLPEPDDEEWYHADLIGLAVENTDGTRIGTVATVQDFGGGDLLEVALEGHRKTVFVPFTRDVVPVVNVKDGLVVIDPPPGLMDEEDGS